MDAPTSVDTESGCWGPCPTSCSWTTSPSARKRRKEAPPAARTKMTNCSLSRAALSLQKKISLWTCSRSWTGARGGGAGKP
ncbi:hypothetical protein Q9966_014967 [Columba livia]|nr:hypothetical protein Q9966_014967 [Columba livia]